eukprot:gb/GECG01013030.1/.p1 GENE.gb/GECG01013030.1/~~gb/GECG01013030.1/.p1  ORF type:complete len:330 (+),score=41.96 gb/GECG01013030.1/:1-990(+)
MLSSTSLDAFDESVEDAYNGVSFNRRSSMDADQHREAALPTSFPYTSLFAGDFYEGMSATWAMVHNEGSVADPRREQRDYASDSSTGSGYSNVNPSATRSPSTDIPNPEAVPESPGSTGKRTRADSYKENDNDVSVKEQKIQQEIQFPLPVEQQQNMVQSVKNELEIEPKLPPIVYREYMTSSGSLSSEPLPVCIKLSEKSKSVLRNATDPKTKVTASLRQWGVDREVLYVDPKDGQIRACAPHIKKCKIETSPKGESHLLVEVVRKGQLTDPTKSLPLTRSHGNFPFYFVFEIPEAGEKAVSSIFEVRSKETRTTREQRTVTSLIENS